MMVGAGTVHIQGLMLFFQFIFLSYTARHQRLQNKNAVDKQWCSIISSDIERNFHHQFAHYYYDNEEDDNVHLMEEESTEKRSPLLSECDGIMCTSIVILLKLIIAEKLPTPSHNRNNE